MKIDNKNVVGENLKKKICVVGAGYWGNNHIRTLNELGALGGIVENNKQLLEEFSNKFDVKIYQELDNALYDDNFLGYTVATPAETHYHLAKKIIKSGNHVLIEKPLALNIKDAQELVHLSDEHKITMMVGHLMLFHPAIIKTKELIDSGSIGTLQYIYSNRLNLGQVRQEENVFWSLAPYDISIFQYLTDSFPIDISSKGSSFLQEGIHDSTITQLKYPNGVEGHIFVSWLHPFKEHRLVIIGSEAMIAFDDSAVDKPFKLYSKKFDMSSGLPEKLDGPIKTINYENKMPLTEELKYFINNLNSSKPLIADGKHALEVIDILVNASKQLV